MPAEFSSPRAPIPIYIVCTLPSVMWCCRARTTKQVSHLTKRDTTNPSTNGLHGAAYAKPEVSECLFAELSFSSFGDLIRRPQLRQLAEARKEPIEILWRNL